MPTKPATESARSPIVRTNRAFIQIREIGEVDEKGKVVFAKMGFKKVIAAPDRPLCLFAEMIQSLVIPSFGYSCEAEAEADVKAFKEWAASLEIALKP